MANKTYYKVLSSELQSARASSWGPEEKGKFCVKYNLTGRWVYPKFPGTKIFVFDTFKNARDFASNRERIFECQVLNPIQMKYISVCGVVEQIWKARQDKKAVSKIRGVGAPPRGTMFGDAVKIGRELNRNGCSI